MSESYYALSFFIVTLLLVTFLARNNLSKKDLVVRCGEQDVIGLGQVRRGQERSLPGACKVLTGVVIVTACPHHIRALSLISRSVQS